MTSAAELAMAQAAATASGKERSGLLTSVGHCTLKQFQFRIEKLNVRIHTLVDTSSLEFSCRCFALWFGVSARA